MQQVEPGTLPTKSVKSAVEGLAPHETRNSKNNIVEEKQRFHHWTIRDYAHAYASGRVTPTQVPVTLTYFIWKCIKPMIWLCIIDLLQLTWGLLMIQVAERFLSGVEESNKLVPRMNLFIAVDSRDVLLQAAAATERYEQGALIYPEDSFRCYSLKITAITSFQSIVTAWISDAIPQQIIAHLWAFIMYCLHRKTSVSIGWSPNRCEG